MRSEKLVVALRRTSERLRKLGHPPIIVVVRGSWKREITIEAAVLMIVGRDEWVGLGKRRKLDKLVWSPSPKPAPEWERCYRTEHGGLTWFDNYDRQRSYVSC